MANVTDDHLGTIFATHQKLRDLFYTRRTYAIPTTVRFVGMKYLDCDVAQAKNKHCIHHKQAQQTSFFCVWRDKNALCQPQCLSAIPLPCVSLYTQMVSQPCLSNHARFGWNENHQQQGEHEYPSFNESLLVQRIRGFNEQVSRRFAAPRPATATSQRH